MPKELLSILEKPIARSGPASRSLVNATDLSDGRFSAWITRGLNEGVVHIRQAEEGERNDTLNRVSFGLATYVAAAKLPWDVYARQLKLAAVETGLTEEEADRTVASAWEGGQKQPCEWITTAQRYVYVSARGQFYNVAARQGITESAFNRTHNSERQWEKGAIATFLTDGDFMEKALDLRFDPTQPTGVYLYNNERWLNTYVDPAIEAVDGDASPFIEFVEHLIPNQNERAHLLQMIAWTVRNPGKKLGHALLLRTEKQGVGKSMLIDIWRNLLGYKNTRLTTTEEITGNFQSFIDGNLLVVVEELNIAFGMQGYNRIKNLITGSTAEINEKFVSSRERPNLASFAFLTNLSEPILIEDSDRRLFFIDSPALPREPEFYNKFVSWWEANLGILRAYIDSIDLSQFNPFAPPPETEAKKALRLASRSPLEQEIAEAMAERRFPFSRDIVRLEEIKANIPAAHSVPLQRLRGAMRALGAEPLGSHRCNGQWVSIGTRPTFVSGSSSKPSLWAASNVDYWKACSPQSRVEEFCRSIGMLTEFDGTSLAIGHALTIPSLLAEMSSCPRVQAPDDARTKERVQDIMSSDTSRMQKQLRQYDSSILP